LIISLLGRVDLPKQCSFASVNGTSSPSFAQRILHIVARKPWELWTARDFGMFARKILIDIARRSKSLSLDWYAAVVR
jgi:hypothetical protein